MGKCHEGLLTSSESGEESTWNTEFLRLHFYSCKLNGFSCKLSCNSCRLTCLMTVQAKRARARTPTPGSYRGTKPLMDRDGPPRGRHVFAELSCFHFLQFLACFLVYRAVFVFLLPAHVSEVDKLIGKKLLCLSASFCEHKCLDRPAASVAGSLLTTQILSAAIGSRHSASRNCCLTCNHTCVQGSIPPKRYIPRTS